MKYPLNAYRLPGTKLNAWEITVNQTEPPLHELAVCWRRQTSKAGNYHAVRYSRVMGYRGCRSVEEHKSGT